MKRFMTALMGMAALLSAECHAQGSTPKVIAHRGFWKAVPQVPHNSIASLENAIALGCFGTEFDVWLTSDGVPVVYHDGKTKTGVVIEEVTYAELMERGGFLAGGEKIPTLDGYLAAWDRSDKRVKLIFEIKSHRTPGRDRAAARKVHETALAHNIKPGQMEYISFSREVCRALRDIKCGVPVAYLEGDLAPADALRELGITGIDYNIEVLKSNPAWIRTAQDSGITVNVWTVDSDAGMQWCIDAGVDYITTDRPDALMRMIAAPAVDAGSRATQAR